MLKIQKKTYSWRTGLFMAATAISTAIAAITPAHAQFGKLSEAEEIRAGQQAAQQAIKEFGKPLPANHPMSRRVKAIGARFAALSTRKNIPYSYTVLQNNQVLNAFAAPGGPVFVTTKLVQTTANDAELAYVIGHETGHIENRHIAKSVEKQQQAGLVAGILGAILGRSKNGNILGTAVNLTYNLWQSGYSRDQESDADNIGVRWMSRLGYDPRAAVSMMGKLGSGSGGIGKYLSSHPDPKTRQRRVSELIEKENLLDVARRSGGPRLSDAGSNSGYSYASDDYPNTPAYNENPNYPSYDGGYGATGREISFGAPLMTVDRGQYNVILAPVAGVADWANATIRNNGNQTVVRRGNNTLELRRNSTVAYVNNRARELSVAPQIQSGRLYAPLGDLIEGLGGTAQYDGQNNVARITLDGQESIIRLS
jgi:Zn-dependent protease with chaperone function